MVVLVRCRDGDGLLTRVAFMCMGMVPDGTVTVAVSCPAAMACQTLLATS